MVPSMHTATVKGKLYLMYSEKLYIHGFFPMLGIGILSIHTMFPVQSSSDAMKLNLNDRT